MYSAILLDLIACFSSVVEVPDIYLSLTKDAIIPPKSNLVFAEITEADDYYYKQAIDFLELLLLTCTFIDRNTRVGVGACLKVKSSRQRRRMPR